MASLFAALGHPSRVAIVRLLLAAHPDGLVVSEIQSDLDLAGSTLSHHLDAMRQVGLIEMTREGRYLRYRAGTQRLQSMLSFLYAECCSRQPQVPISLPEISDEGSGADTVA